MKNKYSRHNSVINRASDDQHSEDHWLKEFESKLNKEAVQPYKNQNSIFDQINSIMNGKSKHHSVDAAVKDMQERSGLTAYLNNLKASEKNNTKTKTASDEQNAFDKDGDVAPIVIEKHPEILNTIKNYIETTKGNISVPAIIEHVKSIHRNDVSDEKSWDDDNLIRLVSKLNLKEKAKTPENTNTHNLGKVDYNSNDNVDQSNSDAFFSLMPAKQ
jgi:glutaredoxin